VKGVSRCRLGDGYREMEWNSRGERRVYWRMVLVHIIYALWLALVVYLSVSAIGVKGEPQAHLGQSLGLLFAVVAAFALPHLPFFSFGNFAPANAVASTIGFALCVAGMAFLGWARQHLGRNWSQTVAIKEGHELVTSGPYRYVRHPMYTGGLVAGIVSALAAGERGYSWSSFLGHCSCGGSALRTSSWSARSRTSILITRSGRRR
jgi:protein-S-isoprenylcysteine O-methyltransferase Ste14